MSEYIDRLTMAEALEAGGFTDKQARALATAIKGALTDAGFATKAEMDHRFDLMDQRFISLEQRMTIKLGLMLVGAVGATGALMHFLR